jgi:hypothetical protein
LLFFPFYLLISSITITKTFLQQATQASQKASQKQIFTQFYIMEPLRVSFIVDLTQESQESRFMSQMLMTNAIPSKTIISQNLEVTNPSSKGEWKDGCV